MSYQSSERIKSLKLSNVFGNSQKNTTLYTKPILRAQLKYFPRYDKMSSLCLTFVQNVGKWYLNKMSKCIRQTIGHFVHARTIVQTAY